MGSRATGVWLDRGHECWAGAASFLSGQEGHAKHARQRGLGEQVGLEALGPSPTSSLHKPHLWGRGLRAHSPDPRTHLHADPWLVSGLPAPTLWDVERTVSVGYSPFP